MSKRMSEEEILALIEEQGASDERLESLAADDPQLARWIRAARRDRELAESLENGVRAPEGLVEDALAEAERRALVGATTHAPHAGRKGRRAGAGRTPAGHRRIRVTPLGLTIAAGLFIAAGAATVLPVLISQPGQGIAPTGPVTSNGGAPESPEQNEQTLAQTEPPADSPTGPLDPLQSMVESAAPVSGQADDSVGATGARAAPDEPARPDVALPEAAPSQWLTLAKQGRLGVLASEWSDAALRDLGARSLAAVTINPPGARVVASLEIDVDEQRVRERVEQSRQAGGETARIVALEDRFEHGPALEPDRVFWWTEPAAFNPRERATILLLVPSASGE